ncbi:MAG: hypothetical protein QOJ03_2816 [Frankiaceae bacterium]|nr:hypothetical protein [Frankiaceae bacterium]
MGALLAYGALAPAIADAATSYGPWSGTVRLDGPVDQGNPNGTHPGANVSATYTLGSQHASDTTVYDATIAWTVSGKSPPNHDCGSTGTVVGYSYQGSGSAAGTVQIAWSAGNYQITASSPAKPKFTVTDNCPGNPPPPSGTTPLGPATRLVASTSDNKTALNNASQTSRSDSWTVTYNLARSVVTPTPTPSASATKTPKPTGTPTSATPSTTATPTATATPHHRRHPSATPTPTESSSPVALPTTPPPSAGPPDTGQPGPSNPGDVSGFTRHVADASQIATNGRTLLLNAALALLLVIMLLFPAELFNGTLMENYDEVRGWFGPLGRLGTKLESHPLLESRSLRLAGVTLFTAITAGVYGLIDPEFGLDGASLRLFIALAFGLVAMTVLANGAALLFVRWRYGVGGHIRLRPGTLVLALGCVLLSRLIHLQPGYVYGIVAGFQFSREIDHAQEGRAVAAWAGWLFALSIGAWLLIEPARHLVEHHEGAFLPLVAEEVTAALTVEGLTVLLLALAPIRFLHGERLLRWNKPAWLVAYAVTAYAFFSIDIHPEWAGTEATVPLRVWLVLFLGFGAFSGMFWSYFRFRHPRTAESE